MKSFKACQSIGSHCIGSSLNEHFNNVMLVQLRNKYLPFAEDDHVYPLNKQVIAIAKINDKLIVPVSVPPEATITRPTDECKFLSSKIEMKPNTIDLNVIIEACKENPSFVSTAEQAIYDYGSPQELYEFHKAILHQSYWKILLSTKYLPMEKTKYMSLNIFLDGIKGKCGVYMNDDIYNKIPKKFKATPENYKQLMSDYNVSLQDLAFVNIPFAPFVEEILFKENRLDELNKFYIDLIKNDKFRYGAKEIMNKLIHMTPEHRKNIIKESSVYLSYFSKEHQTEDLCWLSIRKHPPCIKYVHDDALTLDMCLYVVEQDSALYNELPYKWQYLVKNALHSTRC